MGAFIRFLLTIYALLGCFTAYCQEDEIAGGSKPDTLLIDLSSTVGRVAHSLYNHLEIIDERSDKGALGWLANGTLYGIRVCLAGPMEVQLGRRGS
jgi:hypothetical protein